MRNGVKGSLAEGAVDVWNLDRKREEDSGSRWTYSSRLQGRCEKPEWVGWGGDGQTQGGGGDGGVGGGLSSRLQ